MSKRRHNFGTKRFKEKSLFIFHARIALKSLILLFVRLIARGARIGKTHTQTHRQTHRQNKYCNRRACAPRVNKINACTLQVYSAHVYSYKCGVYKECSEVATKWLLSKVDTVLIMRNWDYIYTYRPFGRTTGHCGFPRISCSVHPQCPLLGTVFAQLWTNYSPFQLSWPQFVSGS